MKPNMSFDDLMTKLRTGDGDGISVRPDGQIVPASPSQSSPFSSSESFRSTQPSTPSVDQTAPSVNVRKTVWGRT